MLITETPANSRPMLVQVETVEQNDHVAYSVRQKKYSLIFFVIFINNR